MKIIANLTEPYSILNPETNSDSPSAKSKGVRFSSASTVILHKNSTRRFNMHKGINFDGSADEKNSSLNLGTRIEIRMKASLIS